MVDARETLFRLKWLKWRVRERQLAIPQEETVLPPVGSCDLGVSGLRFLWGVLLSVRKAWRASLLICEEERAARLDFRPSCLLLDVVGGSLWCGGWEGTATMRRRS